MNLNNIAVFVSTREESEAVQKQLFAAGYTWMSGENVNPLLTDGYIGVYIQTERGDRIFKGSSMEPYKTQLIVKKKEVMAYVLEESRPMTVLFGKTYYTDELEARLAGLEQVKF